MLILFQKYLVMANRKIMCTMYRLNSLQKGAMQSQNQSNTKTWLMKTSATPPNCQIRGIHLPIFALNETKTSIISIDVWIVDLRPKGGRFSGAIFRTCIILKSHIIVILMAVTEFSSTGVKKILEHYRITHGIEQPEYAIDGSEIINPVPSVCPECSRAVSNWEEFYKCI